MSTAEALRGALEDASPGDVVELTAGTYEGSFSVPPGVTLAGAGMDLTEIVAPTELDALVVTGGADGEQNTLIRDMRITTTGGFGVRGSAGFIQMMGVHVVVLRGAGIGIESASSFEAQRVRIEGPVTEATATSVEPEPTVATTATHGLVLFEVSNAVLTSFTVTGTADVAALLVGSEAEFIDSTVSDVLGTGLYVLGGEASIVGLEVENVFHGVRLVPSYGVVVVGDAQVTSLDLAVRGSEDVGVLQVAASSEHERIAISGNRNGGVWVQNSPLFRATDGTIDTNGLVGVLLAEVGEALVRDVNLAGTEMVTRVGGSGRADYGDGIQLQRPGGEHLIERVSFANSARVGFLMDGGGASLESVLLTGCDVGGEGMQLGAVAQNGSAPPGWDDGMARDTVTAANDLTVTAPLDILGIVAPTEIRGADMVVGVGLSGIVAPTE